MNKSINMHVRVMALMTSRYPGDKELAAIFKDTLSKVIEPIIPVLQYVCMPKNFIGRDNAQVNCLPIGHYGGEGPHIRTVYLSETGKFFPVNADGGIVNTAGRDVQFTLKNGTDDWKMLFFDDVLIILQEALKEGVRIREEHNRQLMKRIAILEKVLTVINSNPEA